MRALVPRELSFATPIRLVQVGESAGPTVILAAESLRTSGLEIFGVTRGRRLCRRTTRSFRGSGTANSSSTSSECRSARSRVPGNEPIKEAAACGDAVVGAGTALAVLGVVVGVLTGNIMVGDLGRHVHCRICHRTGTHLAKGPGDTGRSSEPHRSPRPGRLAEFLGGRAPPQATTRRGQTGAHGDTSASPAGAPRTGF